MKSIQDFKQLVENTVDSKVRKRLVVAWPQDSSTQEALVMALDNAIVDLIAVGDIDLLINDSPLSKYASSIRFVQADDSDDAAFKAVQIVKQGEADILMKGMLNTDNLLRAVLNKENGIMQRGNVMTHLTVASVPALARLIAFSDVAVIPFPTLEQRSQQVQYLAKLSRAIGSDVPRIAMIHCSEKVDPKHFPCTADYQEIKRRAADGAYGGVIIDGPLDLKTSLSPAALKKKNIESPVGGEADALLFPDIESGNVFYKTLTLFADTKIAGVILGAQVPIVLPSRGDAPLSKFYSITLAVNL